MERDGFPQSVQEPTSDAILELASNGSSAFPPAATPTLNNLTQTLGDGHPRHVGLQANRQHRLEHEQEPLTDGTRRYGSGDESAADDFVA
jgi:hypothetical protein